MISAPPYDANRREVRLGDWVRVLQVPLSIAGMPEESVAAFSRAVGHTFQVQGIYRNGDLELDMFPKVSYDSIWIESTCCAITRRPSKFSSRFSAILTETLKHHAEHGRPQYLVSP